jgi:hypothetical protein
MSKRTIAIVIAVFSCYIAGILQKTPRVTWSPHTRDTLFALVCCVSSFYIGLDLLRAPKTSLLYRILKNDPFLWWKPLTAVRIAAVFFISGGLMAGWSFLGQLLGLIK